MHAVDDVDLASPPARWSGWSANRAAANRRSAASPAGLHAPSAGAVCAIAARRRARGAAAGARPARRADDLPGPVRLAQPAHARGRHRRRGAGRARPGRARRGRRLRGRSCSSRSASIRRSRARYPHQFSGGQRARIGIARALAVEARAAGLRRSGRRARRVDPGAGAQPASWSCASASALTYLFISHDLGVVRHLSDRVVDHVPRPRGRDGADRGAVRSGRSPLHPGAARRRCRGSHAAAPLRADPRRDPVAARAAAGLPFPSALPARHAALRRGGAGAARGGAGAVTPPVTSSMPEPDRTRP